jgi:hypothetical protein
MKKALSATVCAMFCTGLFAQTATSTAARSDSSADPQNLSNEDRNIRAYIELLRTDLRKGRSQVMGEVLRLDTEQAQKFWPIYKEFETELTKIGDQIVAVMNTYVANYDKMPDSLADKLANSVLSIEQQRNTIKKKYFDRLRNSVGAVTAMRFLQVENQLERLVDLQLAAQLPVSEE